MTELDKFKRRTIRSVARLLIKEKTAPDEIWRVMKKETGTDCRTLWERMRALCVKKLNRMIAVDDRSASLPSIARLSLTDWLLVDLVLVHEDIDVICMDTPDNKEFPALIELFNLVQRFDVEGRSGEPLAEAWAAATVHYNRQGRQCSPMLLQRRWYQLKKLTRDRFYKFWFSYRGNTRLLEEARKTMPSRLHMAIAKSRAHAWRKKTIENNPEPEHSDVGQCFQSSAEYPPVITKEYPDWEELIEKRFVIMPEEFEAKMRMPNLPKPCNSNAPDLLVVEPVIETIDLRVESDMEDNNDYEMEDNSDPERSNDATDVAHVSPEEETVTEEVEVPVKHEKNTATAEEIPHNDEALGVGVETEPIQDGLSNVKLISATHVPEVEIADDTDDTPVVAPSVVKTENLDDDEGDVIAIPSLASDVVQQMPADSVQPGAEIPPDNSVCNVDTINDSDEVVDDIIKVKAEEFCRKMNEVSGNVSTVDDLIKDKVDTYLKTPKDLLSVTDNKPDGSIIDLKSKTEEATVDLMADLNFVDDGIEFVDDGVEFVEEDLTIEPNTNIPSEENLHLVNQMKKAKQNDKIDLKLLMDPVVYTTKVDQMKIFRNKDIDSVKGVRDIEMALVESRPVSIQSLDVKIKEESITSGDAGPEDSDDLFTNREVTDDEDTDEDETVSPNSYMLKKPRTRTYDPIKICKNPDFNTKLKRLTIGFLSSTRNRQLLNACIPMTIDLSKAFESKLVNGTLYLKSSGLAQTDVKQEVIEKQATSIVPTAMPVQSLIDNSKVDIEKLISYQSPITEPVVIERTKVINLPDIDKVRRINQQLLTAQVPPLRVSAGLINEPLQEVNQNDSTAPYIEPQPVSESTSIQNTLPKIKVEGEKSADNSLPEETLPPAKEKLLKIINQAKILTKEALDKIDDVAKPKDFPMPIVINEVKNNMPPEMPTRKNQPRVQLAWAPKPQTITNSYDGLLTSDTLNKMLHLLMSGDKDGKGCKCCHSNKNEKNKTKCKTAEVEKKAETRGRKPKLFPVIQPQTQNAAKVVPIIKVVKSKYCCWASQKISNRKKITKHLCPPDPCKCCCAKKLIEKIKADEEKRKLQEEENRRLHREMMAARNVVELSDEEEDSLRKACESIETVVQQSVQQTDQCNENGQEKNVAAAVAVVDETLLVPNVTVVPTGKPVTPSISVEVVAPSVSKVTIDLGVPSSERRKTPTTPPKPYIKIRAAPISSLMPNQSVTGRRPIIPRSQITVNRTPAPRLQNEPQLKRIPSGQWASCSCRCLPAVGQNSRKYIVIDASNNCAVHPTPVPLNKVRDPKNDSCLDTDIDKLNRRALHPTPIAAKVTQQNRDAVLNKNPKNDNCLDTEIDKLNRCALHPTPIAPKVTQQNRDAVLDKKETPNLNKEKILYLHSKSLAKSPSESPIFLGKNKILLTTVKFPQKNEEAAPPTEDIQAPKVIPTLPLPAGVQLVLMPSGDVTYTLDPGVEIDEQQLATLPTILAAVQEQLNATGVTSTTSQISGTGHNEPVSCTNMSQSDVIEEQQAESNVINETTEPVIPVTLETSEVFQDTDLPVRVTNTVDLDVEAESTKGDTPTEEDTSATPVCDLEKITALNTETKSAPVSEQETVPSVEEETATNLDKGVQDTGHGETLDSEVPTNTIETLSSAQTASAIAESHIEIVQETQRLPNEKETRDNKDACSNKKNLLSDLMEMSGISAEDTSAPEPPAPEPPAINLVEPTANISVNSDFTMPELSPVTSFAELKYACEQNGKFFKLDLESGVIVPINVCIKKNPKNKTTPTKTKEFIDLTEDVENTEVEIPENQDTMNDLTKDRPPGTSMLKEPAEYVYNGKTFNISNTVKPVKLFKAYRQAPPRLLRRTVGPSSASGVLRVHRYDSLIKRTHVEKRKQIFNDVKAKVEAKIDLIDSDEPMEEEYLVSSDDDDSDDGRIEASRKVLEAIRSLDDKSSSDSSDDEPLAKKSKRLNTAERTEENIRETNIFDEIAEVHPDESIDTPNDVVPSISTGPTNSELNDKELAVRRNSETKDAVPTNSDTDLPNKDLGEPPAKVSKIIESNVIRTEDPVDNDLNDSGGDSEGEDLDRASEDGDLDRTPPELTFLSDHSEGGDDNCILGF